MSEMEAAGAVDADQGPDFLRETIVGPPEPPMLSYPDPEPAPEGT